jgi:tetratricopeptide (TPR) repeat protein
MFGTILDVGTFWYVFIAFLLLFLSSIIINNARRARIVLLGTILSIGAVFVFQLFRFFNPNTLSLGVLGAKTENLIGSWNTFGVFAGLMIIILLFIIEFIKVPKYHKMVIGFLLFISLLLAASVNFSLIWQLTGALALIIFVYKISLFSAKKEERQTVQFPIFSFVIVMLCMLFFMSSQFIGGIIPNKLGLSNIEIRPSVASTYQIAKSSLREEPILGHGPNKFAEIWSKHKPEVINDSQFWNTVFTSGSGSIPTLMINTGVIGILGFLLFFILFFATGAKALFSGVRKGVSPEASIFFLSASYLFIASWFYSTGYIVLPLAFTFTGIFVGTYAKGRNDISISFLGDAKKSFIFILSLIVLMILAAGLTFKYIERFASVGYFARAYRATAIEDAERSIGIAMRLHPNDLYFRTANEVYLTKINSLLNKDTSLTDAERVELQNAFTLAEQSAIAAENYNKMNYLNYQVLGGTYSIAASLGVEGASEKALVSLTSASNLNPINPGLKLAIAQLYFTDRDITQAKSFTEQALALKPDYINALVFFAQMENSLGNRSSAISYGEKALSFAPNNKELADYVNSLKNGSRVSAPPVSPLEDTSSGQ